MANNFEDIMSKKTDADLFKIIAGPAGDYQSAALEAAQKEFAKRNLTEDQFADTKQGIEQEKKIKDDKANEPLGIGWKILTFVFPGLLQIMLSGGFRLGGYDRKVDELVRWTLYGFVFYFGVSLLIALSR